MQPKRGNSAGTVLICGAGIAGTVLAYRLARAGLRPTVVERSADLRQAGNAVDLRGPALQVMADMGVLAELEMRATQLSEFFRIDSSGKRVFTMAPHVIGGEIELLRTELNAVLFNAAQAGVEYCFGDSIRSLDEGGDDVAVTFDSGRRGHFGVVIGADGLHSRTRTLAFGPESNFVRHLGCYQAHFTTGNVLGLRNAGLLLNRPGRTLGCYTVHQNTELVIGLFFESAQRAYDRADPAAQRHWTHRVFEGMGWRTAELLEAMWTCDDFYFDSIAQVSLANPCRGRVALVGDAAYGISTTLTSVSGLSRALVPFALSLYGIGMVTGNVLGGWMADRSVVRAIAVGLVLVAAMLLIFAAVSRNPWAALALVFAVGVSGTSLVPALQTRLMDVADDAQTLAAALNHSALNIANAGGAWLGGLVITAGYGYRAPSLVGAALAVAGLVVLGLSVLYARLRVVALPSRAG
ncbi:Conserved hypothetical protein (Putative monooxygenase) [Mycobacteroides abscessus]|nr:Conserved hypothetical protein (Putative monooxygenase) [Mycobacteroides abscessus]